MALIECSECKALISDAAKACPTCGNPTVELVTTQQTSKRFKAAQLAGAVLMLAGMVACNANSHGASQFLFLSGLSVWIFAKAAAWWHNG